MFESHLLIILPDSIVHSMLSDLLMPILSTARDSKRGNIDLAQEGLHFAVLCYVAVKVVPETSLLEVCELHKMEVSSSQLGDAKYFSESALSVLRDWESH